MSRSYRRNGFAKWQGNATSSKRHANKVVRKTEDVPNGKAYKKAYCSWNICEQGAWLIDWELPWVKEEPWKYKNK